LISSASSDPDTPWPSNFPQAFFSGWGDAMIRVEDRATAGTLSASAGVLTLDGTPGFTNHFSSALEPGNKIFIAGTDPICTNNLCTVVQLKSAAQVTVAENITKPSGTAFVALRFGVRIQKTATPGTITVGATYKVAGSVNVNNSVPIAVREDISDRTPVGVLKTLNQADGVVFNTTDLYTVPAGKMLVIETESFEGQVPAGQVIIRAKLQQSSITSLMNLNFTYTGTISSLNIYQGETDAKYYVTEGTTIYMLVCRSDTDGNASYTASFSGYLVPVPSVGP